MPLTPIPKLIHQPFQSRLRCYLINLSVRYLTTKEYGHGGFHGVGIQFFLNNVQLDIYQMDLLKKLVCFDAVVNKFFRLYVFYGDFSVFTNVFKSNVNALTHPMSHGFSSHV